MDENNKGLNLSDSGPSTGVTRGSTDGRVQLTVTRLGPAVQVGLSCANDYTAIEIYERIIQSIKDGCLRIDLTATTPL